LITARRDDDEDEGEAEEEPLAVEANDDALLEEPLCETLASDDVLDPESEADEDEGTLDPRELAEDASFVTGNGDPPGGTPLDIVPGSALETATLLAPEDKAVTGPELPESNALERGTLEAGTETVTDASGFT